MAAARPAGYDNVNLDLIYGAEGESLESWERTLREAIALAPEHVSAYALTVEPATALGRRSRAGRARARPGLQADMFEWRAPCCAEAGYHHYEVSNWARPGFECRHNLGYWERRPYVGLGAGAHAYRDDVRWWNVRPPETYMEQVEAGELPIGGSGVARSLRRVPRGGLPSLRILEGVPASWFDGAVRLLVASGLLVDEFGQLVPTERGMLLLNELVLGLTG